MAETVESPVRGNAHAGFGERLAETGRWRHRYRAAGRLNHPGAQLRFTDRDGLRLTAFVTNTEGGQLPDLELRHRRRARCEDRIRILKDTGLENLPLHGFDQNRIWLALAALAVEVTAWMQMLALTDDPASRWEPKRLRLRLFAIAGRIARHARKVHLRLSAHAPWIDLLITALTRLNAIPDPL